MVRGGSTTDSAGTLRLLACLVCAALVSAAGVAASDGARADLTRAEEEFNVANFGGALAIVNRLTAERALEGDDLRDAFAIKARCEAELGNRADAMDAFCEVIAIDPKWRPNPTLYTPTEIAIFEEAEGGCSEREKAGGPVSRYGDSGGGSNRKWWLIGGGLLAAVLVIALAGGGGGDGGTIDDQTPDLPDFPDPPEN